MLHHDISEMTYKKATEISSSSNIRKQIFEISVHTG